ncbi:MAG: hypothetical protein HGA65_20620 [Oscillochloris sp.]|nr:hypothetical protein [Oscillochloris sp.]
MTQAASSAGISRSPCKSLEAVFDDLLTNTRHRFDALGLPSWPAADLLLFWGGVQLGVNPFEHNPVGYARAVDVPVLLLYGEDDPWVRPPEREPWPPRCAARSR